MSFSHIILSLLACGLAFYVFFVVRLSWGLRRLPRASSSSLLPSVTVVIPARNEEDVVGRCVESVLAQDYPRDRLNIAVVDDDSDDRTGTIAKAFAERNPRVTAITLPFREGLRVGRKPESIAAGVAASTSDIILTTDADCRHEPVWVRTMVSRFEPGVAMVAGPVQLDHAQTLFGKIEELDFFALIITSAGLIGAGRPIICNGANLAFRRDAYLAVQDGVQISSNDDGTFMSRIVTRDVGTVSYAYTKEAVVRTPGKAGFSEFFRQRRRWASVRSRYLDWTIYLELGMLFLFFLSSLVALGFVPFEPGILPWVIGAWAIKASLDWVALSQGSRAMGVSLPTTLFIPALVFQPFGWVVATILSVISRFEWKGRRFNR